MTIKCSGYFVNLKIIYSLEEAWFLLKTTLTTGEAFLWCKVLYSHKVIACMMACGSSFGQTASTNINSTINTD